MPFTKDDFALTLNRLETVLIIGEAHNETEPDRADMRKQNPIMQE